MMNKIPLINIISNKLTFLLSLLLTITLYIKYKFIYSYIQLLLSIKYKIKNMIGINFISKSSIFLNIIKNMQINLIC